MSKELQWYLKPSFLISSTPNGWRMIDRTTRIMGKLLINATQTVAAVSSICARVSLSPSDPDSGASGALFFHRSISLLLTWAILHRPSIQNAQSLRIILTPTPNACHSICSSLGIIELNHVMLAATVVPLRKADHVTFLIAAIWSFRTIIRLSGPCFERYN